MKKFLLVILMLVMAFPVIVQAQGISRTVTQGVNIARIDFLNGNECTDAMIKVTIRGRSKDIGQAHGLSFLVTEPGGRQEFYELGNFPGGNDTEVYERNICIEKKNGRGTISVHFGEGARDRDKVCRVEYRIEDGYIDFTMK